MFDYCFINKHPWKYFKRDYINTYVRVCPKCGRTQEYSIFEAPFGWCDAPSIGWKELEEITKKIFEEKK